MKKLFAALFAAVIAFTACTKDTGEVDGRWNGYAEGNPNDYVVSVFLDNGSVEIWVIAWGEKYKGSYVMNGSNVTFTIDKAWRSEKRSDGYAEYGISNGSITSQETFALGEGFQWYEFDADALADVKQAVSDTFSLIVDSSTTGHGAAYGRQLVYSKAK